MKTIALFNNKGGVGKTTLAFHLAWMFDTLGIRTVVADLDPQANLTSMFLHEDGVEALWGKVQEPSTIYRAFQPLLDRKGPLETPDLQRISANLSLAPGELAMSETEDALSSQWLESYRGNDGAFRVISALGQLLARAAEAAEAQLVVVDVGPNLGPLNRAALAATDFVAIPLAPDLYSIQALQNLGPTLDHWRNEWSDIVTRNQTLASELNVSQNGMQPIGYIVQQHAMRLDRPVQAYAQWMEKIPSAYRDNISGVLGSDAKAIEQDPNCLATLQHYRSLMPLAQAAHKPMFNLKAADGVMGGHASLARRCFDDFRALATRLAIACGVPLDEALGVPPTPLPPSDDI